MTDTEGLVGNADESTSNDLGHVWWIATCYQGLQFTLTWGCGSQKFVTVLNQWHYHPLDTGGCTKADRSMTMSTRLTSNDALKVTTLYRPGFQVKNEIEHDNFPIYYTLCCIKVWEKHTYLNCNTEGSHIMQNQNAIYNVFNKKYFVAQADPQKCKLPTKIDCI